MTRDPDPGRELPPADRVQMRNDEMFYKYSRVGWPGAIAAIFIVLIICAVIVLIEMIDAGVFS